jgi:hypothetical protein
MILKQADDRSAQIDELERLVQVAPAAMKSKIKLSSLQHRSGGDGKALVFCPIGDVQSCPHCLS